jgi:hypothetical protein
MLVAFRSCSFLVETCKDTIRYCYFKKKALLCLKELNLNFVGFQLLRAVFMNVAIFWDVAPCSLYVNGRFEGKYQLYLQNRKSTNITYLPATRWFLSRLIFDCEDGTNTFLRNVGSHTDCKALYPRSQHSILLLFIYKGSSVISTLITLSDRRYIWTQCVRLPYPRPAGLILPFIPCFSAGERGNNFRHSGVLCCFIFGHGILQLISTSTLN